MTNPGGQDVFDDGELIAFHGDLAEPPGTAGCGSRNCPGTG
ncbi:hypothetical protein [Saccharopolyspora gregorii]